MPNIKPPLGIMPKELWVRQRNIELGEAIIRYHEAGLDVPPQWIIEFHETIQ